ncbi:MAG: M1 family metallopeptidase [Gemmatimonadaceae bacterium]|nr:M1 family metallopeptidase [Gemmatimonadaceae bacterium]
MNTRSLFRAALALLATTPAGLLAQRPAPVYTHADSLRGGNGPGRSWWDVEFYDLRVRVSPTDSTLRGASGITYKVTAPAKARQTQLQIDLQVPLEVDSIVQDGAKLPFTRDGNAFFATVVVNQKVGERRTVTTYYHGKPRAAKNPPWDGGLIWRADSLGNPWVATANQGLGASVWWPTKDTQADEPDSQRVAIRVPDPMVNVSNGRLRRVTHHDDRTTTWEWFLVHPINNYDVAINAGTYEHFSEIHQGERGPLTMDYWPLAFHRQAAEQQFRQAKPMIQCFENWFGPYPWYEDGYKLIETPHLGMEHQSAVGYGNRFQNGYLGTDLSGTGVGLLWDFIIVHESAHEWWGNSLTSKDLADMWVHESFANYAENLYVECRLGKAAGARYVIGTRAKVRNDQPIIAAYGVNAEGSGDMYYKGGNMLHTIRQIIGDDAKWKQILRGVQSTYAHQTVTGAQVQAYISQQAGIDLAPVFAQYLTTTKIPALEWKPDGDGVQVRFADVVPGFALEVPLSASGKMVKSRVTAEWSPVALSVGAGVLRADENYYVVIRRAP